MYQKGDEICHKYYLPTLLTMVLCLLVANHVYAGELVEKNVLILNSYQKGLSWTDDETDGIVDTIEDSGIQHKLAIEYMDWKNYPNQENLVQLYAYFKYKYSKKQIDLIITTDDAALGFAIKNREVLFSNAPIVFCGVNENGVREITQGCSNVIGVIEEVDPEKTVKAALQINPNLKEIYVIYDHNESGLSTGALTIQAIHKIAPGIKVISLNQGRLIDILQQVGQAQPDSILLITTYYMDSEGTAVGFENFCRLVSQKSKVPVFHLYDFGIGNGAIGGYMLSGRLQGESAGNIAVRLLQGENLTTIPIHASITTHYVFDYLQLKRFEIPLNRIPKGSRLINKPFSFFETYRNIVIVAAIIFTLLVIFICILLFYLQKINKMRKELYHSHEELAQLYEELTASDEELKQQFDELTEIQYNLTSSEERYALLFEKMLNGFFVFEPVMDKDKRMTDIRFVTVNPGFESHTNKKAGDIPGKTWMEVFGYHNHNLSSYQKVLQTGEAEHFETYDSNSNIYYLVNVFKIKENQVGVVFDNITEYKLAIKEIRKLNEELEQRVIERTNELQSAVNELEAFTYTVSHDLKSPLRAVDGYSRIILEDFEGELDSEVVEMISNIRNICKDMIDMINKLLQYSTTSRLDLCVEEINTEDEFLSVFRQLKSTCPEREIEFKIETGLPNVIADRVLLTQVIYNLLSNAIKFTRDRKKAFITVGSTITEDEYLFYIKDNGVGFDMEYSSKLFGIFQRLHTNDEFEGCGIGLVTVKKIVQKHGGRTWIEGKSDIGATVYFTLPFAW